MATKATTKQAAEKAQEPAFTKAQLLRAKKYDNRKDLLMALLQEDEQYTFAQAEKLMREFLKGTVM